jgi:shikimate kinase
MIRLIGPGGAGKSTIGAVPAERLNVPFLDGNYEAMRFLIDRDIDMTIKDYRWNATAQGWARHAANDEKMAQWLEEAERQRE